jgi:hypothetical protein
MEVDLRAPGVSIEVTPHEQRWLTTSQYGRSSGAVAAINGGFWSVFDSRAEGLVMHGGRSWPGARDDEFYGFFAVTRDGKAEISPASEVVSKGLGRLLEAVSGVQRILHRGKVTAEAFCDDGCRFRHPRTVAAVSVDGHRVFLTVVDGRQPHSRGISLSALAELLAGLGASDAINLDGGGSAAMYLTSKGGLVSQPADRRERGVLNHVGVFWRPTKDQLAAWRAEKAEKALRAQSATYPRGLRGTDLASPSEGDCARREAGAPCPGGGEGAGKGAGRGGGEGTGGASAAAPGGALDSPPLPTKDGVPSGLSRLLQRHYREWLSPRSLLVASPLALLVALFSVVLLRRRRRKRQA